ncbi:AfsR/SARP family transcriptional regulator [Streptomyces lancefieldiae]|uniref:BTAD domain-containing putative transcriptional regulator n=1 Tax=Streptomyces lancefieldiae TaxID=3075520 RepID=A0ABU3AMD3_9ACTN|nr:BTAD domain-containing putative transcriptional regulator [Streptomyces sp. DSM 40712]MDT0610036.1 BTAD domain-containing putative transcriptional regulator [Streptomyces sp. DSM 40712]
MPIRSARQRTVLVMLLLTPGRVVSVDALAAAVWDGAPPTTSRNQIAICIAALRKILREEAGVDGLIETAPPGYVLHPGHHRIDLAELEELVARARQAAEYEEHAAGAEHFEQALSLWRGPVLDGMTGDGIDGAVTRLTELRLDLAEELAALQLRLEAYRRVIADLAPLVAEHPLREEARALLMRAYHLSGRRADALECFREGRRVLIDELGIEPGRKLQALHSEVLAGAPVTEVPRAERQRQVPRQLPRPTDPFVGRLPEMRLLDELLEASGPPLAVLCGVAGVGKSALAVYWSGRAAERFPDGQLFIDLAGFHERGAPVTPLAALDQALRGLGVPGAAIPGELHERAALYRSTLDGRRVLIVLDNVGSPEQIRPLLPGPGPSRVLITSRAPLSALAGEYGARRIELSRMTEREARELLVAVIGAERVEAEPESARRLADLCDRLPLALRIVATRLISDWQWSLRQLASRLEDRRGRLDMLSPHEGGVRSGVWLSYRELSVKAATLYRLLGQLAVPDFPVWVAAAALDVDLSEAEELLRQLVGAQLLEFGSGPERAEPRFRFQDLLRLYAWERCQAEDPEPARRASLARVLSAMLGLADEAHRQMYGPDEVLPDDLDRTMRLPVGFATELLVDPVDWLESERESLSALIRQAVQNGFSAYAWALTTRAEPLYEIRNYLADWRQNAELALEGARAAGDLRGAGTMLSNLGTICVYQRQYAEAQRLVSEAMVLLDRADYVQGRAVVRRNLAICLRYTGDLEAAARHCTDSLELFRRSGDAAGLSHALGLLAQIELDSGDPERGIEISTQAIEASYQAGSMRNRTQNLYRLAESLIGAGRVDEAEQVCHDVIGLSRGQGDRLGEAYGLCALGEAHWRQGKTHQARAVLVKALRATEEIGDRFLRARINTSLACVEALSGTDTAADRLERARDEFHVLDAPVWQRRTERLHRAIMEGGAGPAVDREALAHLLNGR